MYSTPTRSQSRTVSAKRKSRSHSAVAIADHSATGLAQLKRDALLGNTTVQAMADVVQCVRTVTNRMKSNMQAALARVFGGPASRYQIDQDS